MIDQKSLVLILNVIDELRTAGSWGGETHIQKSLYFLNNELIDDVGLNYVLYKHGPYSFDVHEELDRLSAYMLIEYEVIPPYGPKIRLSETGKKFLRKFGNLVPDEKIANLARVVGDKNVKELEQLATAKWMIDNYSEESDEDLAGRINSIKPHIDIESAKSSLAKARTIISELQ